MNRPGQVNGIPVPYDMGTPELKEMIESSDVARWAAFIALGHKNTQEALDLLVHYLRSKDISIRRAALEAIGYHAAAKSVIKDILTCFEDSSPHVLRTACQVVKSLRVTEAHSQVVNLMSADTVETRQTAVSTISEIWQSSDFAIIVGIYKNDHSDLVKREGAWTLVAHATGENWRLLFNLFRADTTSRHRVWACRLAAQFGTQDIMNQLKALAIDSDGHVRKAAHLAIKQLTRPQVN